MEPKRSLRDPETERWRALRLTLPCVALASCLAACAESRGWMPALVIEAGASLSHATTDVASETAGSRGRASWAARGGLSVAWLPAPNESMDAARRPRAPGTPPGPPCASAAICAWERETRALASTGIADEERTR